MMIKDVILDFDGTLTDVQAESVDVIQAWQTDLASYLGIKRTELISRWFRTGTDILDSPSSHGWVRQGRIVAPATSDPYLFATAITDILLKEEGHQVDEDFMSNTFLYPHYGKAVPAFKPEARDFLTSLLADYSVSIVTNSGTEKVNQKLESLLDDLSGLRIFGSAKKYDVDMSWEAVPETDQVEGLERSLYVRRRKYHEVIEQIMVSSSAKPDEVVVVGDVYEFDLLLPQHMGLWTVLLPNDDTADFEFDAVRAYARGYVARDLDGALRHIRSL